MTSHMTKASFPSDTITIKDVSTGGNSAGNGGDGVNTGNISNSPSIKFDAYNKAEGADVHVNTGDKVYQKAYWDAGGANAEAEKLRRHTAEKPSRTATRNRTAGTTHPTCTPTRQPIRQTSFTRSRIRP